MPQGHHLASVDHRVFPRRRLAAYRTRGGMPATMIRLNLTDGLGPALQFAEGYTIDLPDDIHDPKVSA